MLKVVYLRVRWVSKHTQRVVYASFDPWLHLGILYQIFFQMHSFFAYYNQNKWSHGLILSSKLPIGIMYNLLFWFLPTLRKIFKYLPKNGSKSLDAFVFLHITAKITEVMGSYFHQSFLLVLCTTFYFGICTV